MDHHVHAVVKALNRIADALENLDRGSVSVSSGGTKSGCPKCGSGHYGPAPDSVVSTKQCLSCTTLYAPRGG